MVNNMALLLIIIVLCLLLFINNLTKGPKIHEKRGYSTHDNGTCKPHSWYRDENNHLKCRQCGKPPNDPSFFR